ncbi:M20/M25/M40 family metallo-hydrolase [Niabella drilacis]|uniref:Carboxypeptidase Q n=1 Tax=Niabella drilacis (strain DSM 25811 / CCM 8410 / CCUG 62505 / LMG 26954 / E90) TaxID=1285928 RepID=A0A1G6MW97_NIADE|nr:M20/M25/M40 family metallo-hydrolase [Niabella drilacis]SDC59534.1 Peptidase family M28 [Niabella drilacis]
MGKKLFWIAGLFFSVNLQAQTTDEVLIRKIADEILVNSKAYENLRTLTKTIGGRLAGSPQMYQAEEWGYRLLKESGSENTVKQECMVPHWVRGGTDQATALLTNGKKKELDILALGNTEGTGSGGIKAPVILINSFEELEAKKDQLKGKIVFYNYHFNPRFIRTFEAYGDAVKYRTRGTSLAAKYGALASMVRSMSHSVDNNPHTGGTHYDTAYKKIPAVAIGLQDADWLAATLSKGDPIIISLRTMGHFLPDAKGHNIIGELKGSEFPNEIITIGGHLDSWDICEGAHDDGAGITQTIEILRAYKAIGYKPKRTIRFVLFANEENGARGGIQYADEAAKNRNETHLLALESDAGGFTPRGFGVTCNDAQFAKLKSWSPLLEPYGAGQFTRGGGGTDVLFIHEKLKVPMGELLPDSQRYFDIHHARSDVFEAVNKRELELGAVNLAALIYLVDQYGF